jgi:hypothetical protein
VLGKVPSGSHDANDEQNRGCGGGFYWQPTADSGGRQRLECARSDRPL